MHQRTLSLISCFFILSVFFSAQPAAADGWKELLKHYFDRPITRPDAVANLACDQRVAWAKKQLDWYGIDRDIVVQVAHDNNVSPRLLMTVILNEQSEYWLSDYFQEYIDTGPSRSHGIAQLQVNRILNHRLMSEEEISERIRWSEEVYRGSYPGRGEPMYREEIVAVMLHECLTEDLLCALDMAAREVRYLLETMRASSGSDFTSAFFSAPPDPDNPLGNVRAIRHFANVSEITSREVTLARAVSTAYNTPEVVTGWSFNAHGDPLRPPLQGESHAFNNARIMGWNSLMWSECLAVNDWLGSSTAVAPRPIPRPQTLCDQLRELVNQSSGNHALWRQHYNRGVEANCWPPEGG